MKNLQLMNSKGIAVLFLIIAMLLMVTIGYVISYLISSKQESVIFPIQSNQAFFIAQSGVEFAVRYAADNNWTTTASLDANLNGVARNLGSGRFTLIYNYGTYGDKLISIGEVPIGSEKRRISVSSFTSFLPQVLVVAPRYDSPCWCQGTSRAWFFIQNVGSFSITINAFSGTWDDVGQQKTIERIDMGTPWVTKFLGPPNYVNGNVPASFNQGGNSQTITSGTVLEVVMYWSGNTNGKTIVITFYESGTSYTFTLDPEGRGLGSCPHPC